MKTKLIQNRGITLVALVITIIILIILAAISINALTGENGLTSRAQQAKIEMSESMKNEDVILSGHEATIDYAIGDAKKVSDLYNGVDEVDDENYNEDLMHIGDWVNYTAGIWDTTKEITQSSPVLSTGGYVAGQSRDVDAIGLSTSTKNGITYGNGGYEGWRILNINEDGTIDLISAGSPLAITIYANPSVEILYNIPKVLAGETLGTINENVLSETIDYNMFINSKQHAIEARSVKEKDFVKLTGFNGLIKFNNGYDSVSSNRYTSIWNNNTKYLYSNLYKNNNDEIFNVAFNTENQIDIIWGGGTAIEFSKGIFGIRVVVKLSADTVFGKNPEKLEKDGHTYNKWYIK